MKLRTLAVAGTAMLALAGCGGGGGGASGGQPGASIGNNGAPKALVDAAKCMRNNGVPNWPDPVRLDTGQWGWPDSAPEVDPPAACADQFKQGKQQQQSTRRPVSAAEMTQLRKWADCIRSHNVPDWPDPDADGTFNPPSRLQPFDHNQQLLDANRTCASLEPPGGINMRPPGIGETKPAH